MMTTRAPAAPALDLRRPLQEAAAAVADADRALTHDDQDALRDAALVLGRATYQVLTELECREAGGPRPEHLREVLGWWHQQLDEARLQVALAEMDAHHARDELVLALERRFAGVSDLISSSVERMGVALTSLRKEVQAYRQPGPTSDG